MQPPLRDILFIRQYPTAFEKKTARRRWLRSCVDSRGATVPCAGHEITFFFPGYGQRVRKPHPLLLEKLRSGQITDIVDIGAGGALDPDLQPGDFVLSIGDVPSDSPGSFLPLRRRDEVRDIVNVLAGNRARRLCEGTILTTATIIGSRSARLRLYEQTGCAVVQMEHCWFLQALQRALDQDIFLRLYVTHLEIIADPVPENDTFAKQCSAFFRSLSYCVLRNQHHLGTIKAEFLKQWLT
jgi:hypothetical protein